MAKHSKSFSLVDAISIGVGRMQRNFAPMRRQVEMWRAQQLTNATAKDHIPGVHRGRPGGSEAPGAASPPIVTLRRSTKTESVECLYLSV
jgi:hypothetical protein